MTLLPEEYKNRSLRLGDRRRNQIYEEFERSCPQILHLIQQILEQAPNEKSMDKLSEIRQKCFKGLEQWLNLGYVKQSLNKLKFKCLKAFFLFEKKF